MIYELVFSEQLIACFIETKEYLCNHILLDSPPIGGYSPNY